MTEQLIKVLLSTCGMVFIVKEDEVLMKFSNYEQFKKFAQMLDFFAIVNDPKRAEIFKKELE